MPSPKVEAPACLCTAELTVLATLHVASPDVTGMRLVKVSPQLGDLLYEPKLKDPIPNLTPIFQPNHQTLAGSFCIEADFASKYAF